MKLQNTFQAERFIGCTAKANRADYFMMCIKARLLQGHTQPRPCDTALAPHCCDQENPLT